MEVLQHDASHSAPPPANTGAAIGPGATPVREFPNPESGPGTAGGDNAVPRGVWPVAVVIVVGAFMTQLDAALVNIALARVARSLHAGLADTQWIVSGYLLALVAGLPLCGWAASRIGAGRLWLASLAGFTVASGLCALSTDLAFLVGSRVLQGLAAGLLLPAGQTVIAQVAGRRHLGRVMSTVGTPLVLGPALGPVLGGAMISVASWQWLFLVNLPVGVAGLWLGRRLIPRDRPGPARTLDLPGFGLVAVGLVALTYAVSRVGEGRLGEIAPWTAIGALALMVFTVRCLRRATPLVDLRLLGDRGFAASALISFLAGAVQIGALAVLALHFQLVRGYGVVASGLAMGGFALGAAVLPAAGRLTDRFGGGQVVTAGSLLGVAAFVPLALLPNSAGLLTVELLMVGFGVSNALSVVPASTAAYLRVPGPKMPDAVTSINIVLRLGGAVGTALVVSFLGNHPTSQSAAEHGFHAAFWSLAALSAVCVPPALVLRRVTRNEGRDGRREAASGRHGPGAASPHAPSTSPPGDLSTPESRTPAKALEPR